MPLIMGRRQHDEIVPVSVVRKEARTAGYEIDVRSLLIGYALAMRAAEDRDSLQREDELRDIVRRMGPRR